MKDERERQAEAKIKMIGLRLPREVVETEDLKVAATRSEEKETGGDVGLEVLHLYNIIVLEDEQQDQCFMNQEHLESGLDSE